MIFIHSIVISAIRVDLRRVVDHQPAHDLTVRPVRSPAGDVQELQDLLPLMGLWM